MDPKDIEIPDRLKPRDGRFGSGPSKVRPEAVASLARAAVTYLGTSHRQATVREVAGRIRRGLTELFSLPDGYEVVLGVGGATALWDALAYSFIGRRSQHLVFGEFSAKFARAAAAPHLSPPDVISSEPGSHPTPRPDPSIDVYALTHNETSTGVMMPVSRPAAEGLVVVDGVSAAGGIALEAADFDVYYLSPQKGFASEGGLWIALCSPAAIERIETVAASERYIPEFLSLKIALDNSRKDQTYNTPALATLWLMAEQVDWMLAGGGLSFSAGRCARSAELLYGWASGHRFARPFVADEAMRSPVVGTIDFDGVDAASIAVALRNNGIVDVEPYRKLGRNQLRIAMYPVIDPEDVAALTGCIDHVIERLLDT